MELLFGRQQGFVDLAVSQGSEGKQSRSDWAKMAAGLLAEGICVLELDMLVMMHGAPTHDQRLNEAVITLLCEWSPCFRVAKPVRCPVKC